MWELFLLPCLSQLRSFASITKWSYIDPSDPLRPPNLLKWPATSTVTRSHVAHLPMHGNPTAPPSFLPASAIPLFHMGFTRLCEPEVLQDPSLTMRPGLLHSPPSQARTSPLSTWPSCNIRLSLANFLPKFLPLCKLAIRNRLRITSLRSFPALAPLGQSRKTAHAAPAPKLMSRFKNFRELLAILSLPGWTS